MREAVQHLYSFGLPIIKACKAVGLNRSTFYRQPKDWRIADSAVIDAINAELKRSPQAGFWKIFRRIR